MYDETIFWALKNTRKGHLNNQGNFASAEHCHYWVHCTKTMAFLVGRPISYFFSYPAVERGRRSSITDVHESQGLPSRNPGLASTVDSEGRRQL